MRVKTTKLRKSHWRSGDLGRARLHGLDGTPAHLIQLYTNALVSSIALSGGPSKILNGFAASNREQSAEGLGWQVIVEDFDSAVTEHDLRALPPAPIVT